MQCQRSSGFNKMSQLGGWSTRSQLETSKQRIQILGYLGLITQSINHHFTIPLFFNIPNPRENRQLEVGGFDHQACFFETIYQQNNGTFICNTLHILKNRLFLSLLLRSPPTHFYLFPMSDTDHSHPQHPPRPRTSSYRYCVCPGKG